MNVEKLFVVGAGTMGNGIAQVAAAAGFQVTLMDIDPAQLARAKKSISQSIEKLHKKERISADQREAALSIPTVTTLEEVAEADLVIEAISENPELKFDLFRDLDARARPEAILASNTSSISLTKIGAVTARPEQVIGMHFMNPVPLMRLVEVIRGLTTSDATTETVIEVSEKMGKVPVEANDSPGFISNRVLSPMINEAVFALQEGWELRKRLTR